MPWESFSFKRADAQTRREFALIGRAVLSRRRRAGMSQRQLQALCGVHQTVISRLENGRLASLRWARFAELVDALGGLGEGDSMQAWMTRSLPANAGGGTGGEAGIDDETHQARPTATIVERRDGNGTVSRSPTTPSANVGQ